MKKRPLAIWIIALSLWAATASGAASDSQAVPPDAGARANERSAKYDGVSRELKTLEEGLAVMKGELARLRRKWTVTKGRTPTDDELKEFEKKRAKGEVKSEDNPFVNRNALGTPGRWREAYYKKLEEIRKDEERVVLLERELDGLGR